MRLPRYTIRSLLLVILFVGVAVAGLREANDAWDAGLLGLTLLILLTGTLLAVHRTDRRRAYWLGFALFGWTYLVASLIPPIGARLPTTKGLAFIDSKNPGREKTFSFSLALTSTATPNSTQTLAFSPQGNTLSVTSPGTFQVWNGTTGTPLAGPGGSTENFLRIGHSILAWVMAFVGGVLSRYLYDQDRSRMEHAAEPGG